MRVFRRISRRSLGIVVALVVLAGGGGYVYYNSVYLPAQPSSESSIQTTRVRRGDLVILASGSGTVIPSAELALGFASTGTLAELLVEVGDEVQAGDVLARLDESAARQGVTSAEIQLISAQLELASTQSQLDELLAGSSEADIVSAEAALATAQETYQRLVDGPDASEIEEAELALARTKNSLWSAQSSRAATCGREGSGSSSCNQAEASVANAEISVRLAEITLQELMEPATQTEIQVALSEVAQAQAHLEELIGGPSEEDIATAEAQVEQARLSLAQAELNLESAQEALEQTTLVAPMDGTVMAVSVGVGEAVSGSLITLADLSRTRLEIYLDQTDLDKMQPGYEVEVVFDALPDEVFTGRVVAMDPSLVTEGGISAIRGVAELDEASLANPQPLLVGLDAAVDVIAARAEGVMLVPLEALRELTPGEYGVFVMEGDEPVFRTVEVGLTDFTFAEIVFGLEVGEIVTTGIVQTG